MKRLISLVLMFLLATIPTLAEGGIAITATTYPLYDLAKNIGGEYVEVTYAPENATEAVDGAQILLCMGAESDAWANDLKDVTVLRAIDVSKVALEGDAEVLTIPINLALCASTLGATLSQMDSDHAQAYMGAQTEYMNAMFALDTEFRNAMKQDIKVRGEDGSMAYFAEEYDVEYAPDDETAIALRIYSFPSEEDMQVPYIELMERNLDALIQTAE